MGAKLNPTQRLHSLGQSLWLDSINRVMLRTGALARYVRELAVTGLTSNPTILGHAMAAGSDYDRSLAHLSGEGVTGAQDLVYALALEDLAQAASLFRPEWEAPPAWTGMCRWRYPQTSPTTPRPRSPWLAAPPAGRLPQPAGKDPRHSPGPDRHGRDDHRRDRGERDAAVLRQPLPAHRRRLHSCPATPPRRGAGPGGAVSGLNVYLRWTQPPTPCCRRRFMACWGWRWRRRPTPPICSCCQTSAGRHSPRPRASATAAVGIHLDQEPRSSRHLLSGPPGRPQHHRHCPGKDAARLRRSWNPG